MGDLSEHFSRRELACHHCGALAPADVLAHLVRHLEQLRALVGRPLVVVSAYRCKRWNTRVGGARTSRHLFGDAIDLRAGYCTVDQAVAAGFTGIGTKHGEPVHIDLRPDAARWTY